jgi:hypothetical protein
MQKLKLTDPSTEACNLQVIPLTSRWGLESDHLFQGKLPLTDNEWAELNLILGNDSDLEDAKEIAIKHAMNAIEDKRHLLAAQAIKPSHFQIGIASLQDTFDGLEGVNPNIDEPIRADEWQTGLYLLERDDELNNAIDAALERAAVHLRINRNIETLRQKISNK